MASWACRREQPHGARSRVAGALSPPYLLMPKAGSPEAVRSAPRGPPLAAPPAGPSALVHM